ncbi:hypothetical protein V1524DRAFT_428048 [Lipomyces starkeyi]
MGSYSDEEDNRRIYLVSSALSPEEYRYYPHWFAELVPPGHLTLTLDDMLVFADRFGIAEQDKWKIFDTFESPLSTLEKGEFYAFVRLIGHVMNGKAPSRALVFQQAPVPKIIQESAVVLQSDVTTPSSASQRSSLTLPASTTPSTSNPPSGLPVSPVLDGTRVNPFRRHHEQKSRESYESRKSAESMTRTVSVETPETRMGSTDKTSNDIQAVDAFTQMLLGEISDATPRKSSESAVSDHSSIYQVGISETKQNDPIFEMSDVDESSSSSEEDEDDEAVDEESTSTAKNMTPDDSISLGSIGKLDFQQPTIHTIQSQHYLVMPKELEINPPPRKSLETDHSKRPAPPPPRPRKGGYGSQSSVSPSNPVVTATMTPSSEPSTVPLTSVGSSRSSSSSSLPKSLSAPAPPISHTDKRKSSVGGISPSLSSTPSFNSSQRSSSTPDVSAPAHATTFSDVDFDAAFDGQQLFPAVASPPDTRANAPQTALASQKSHVPPPPPPSRRKVSHTRDQSIASAQTTRGHRPHPHPQPHPPPPPPPSTASHSLSNSTSGTTTSPSSKAASVDDSAVPDLLADLTALQREVDALREQHLRDT